MLLPAQEDPSFAGKPGVRGKAFGLVSDTDVKFGSMSVRGEKTLQGEGGAEARSAGKHARRDAHRPGESLG